MNYLSKEIVVIGLGYVGLPLALNLSNNFKVIGFDISNKRVEELKIYNDVTKEVTFNQLKKAQNLKVTDQISYIKNKFIYIITVPTPVTQKNLPDLKILKKACKTVGSIMAKNAIVIFESTVYPGVTEKICAKILSKESGYKLNLSFYLGYSPERINPGDKKHSLNKITKVISGSNEEITKTIGKIYNTIIKAGIFYAKSIEVAETAKAIENAQRDINIAFMNEVALLCDKLNISVYDVIDAASTKWNFLPFRPGLVGGHCIGVDPYYLAHVAKNHGASADIILSGRRLNDNMTSIVFKKIKKLIKNNHSILQLGVTFKENVTDIRNSKSIELVKYFIDKKYKITVYDPIADANEVFDTYGVKLSKPNQKYDCIIISVPHEFILKNKNELFKYIKKSTVIFDITGYYKDMFVKNNIKYKSF